MIEILNKKVTIQFIREKYPEKYKDLTDDQLQKKIDFLYVVAGIGMESFFKKKNAKYKNKNYNMGTKGRNYELNKSNTLHKSIV